MKLWSSRPVPLASLASVMRIVGLGLAWRAAVRTEPVLQAIGEWLIAAGALLIYLLGHWIEKGVNAFDLTPAIFIPVIEPYNVAIWGWTFPAAALAGTFERAATVFASPLYSVLAAAALLLATVSVVACASATLMGWLRSLFAPSAVAFR